MTTIEAFRKVIDAAYALGYSSASVIAFADEIYGELQMMETSEENVNLFIEEHL